LQQNKDWSSRLRESLTKTLAEALGSSWGYHMPDNLGLEADLVEEFDKIPAGGLQLQKRSVTPHGIEIQATVGDAITSLQEVTKAVYDLLYSVGENFFLLLPILDSGALRYWFVIGSAAHGHIGEVIIQRESIPQIDLSVLDMIS